MYLTPAILNSCKSYDAMTFNKLLLLEDRQTSSSVFSSYFLNIDGNATNFESFITELHRLNNNFMVLGLAETNCTSDNKSLYNIPNFTSFYQDVLQVDGINKKKGTGVALYVHSSLNAVLDTENSFINPHIETLFISITNTPKLINIGVVYRPPSGDTTLFLNSYQKLIKSLSDKTSYIMGDFNINLLNPSQHGFKDYEQILLNSNFSPLISRTTHEIPGRKKSCIDNIHTNDHQNVIVSGTLSDKISHHLPIFHFSNIICKDDCRKVKSVQYYEFCKSNVDNKICIRF